MAKVILKRNGEVEADGIIVGHWTAKYPRKEYIRKQISMSTAEIKLTANERRKADREAAVAASFREIWPVVQAAGYKPNRALDEVAERHELTRAGVVGILRRLGIYKSAKQIILN